MEIPAPCKRMPLTAHGGAPMSPPLSLLLPLSFFGISIYFLFLCQQHQYRANLGPLLVLVADTDSDTRHPAFM